MEATYYFDPACPFTWRTSRWLVAVAPERDVTVRWRGRPAGPQPHLLRDQARPELMVFDGAARMGIRVALPAARVPEDFS